MTKSPPATAVEDAAPETAADPLDAAALARALTGLAAPGRIP
ncbi:MAG TPA: hypothetical protein VLF66_01340 [Thermoanaerobaculia bacterium]|nr:hypothetical protein [Thermoanaerobaculia bacterium]